MLPSRRCSLSLMIHLVHPQYLHTSRFCLVVPLPHSRQNFENLAPLMKDELLGSPDDLFQG